MEPIVVFALLLMLAIAAPRWGYDSRDAIRSKDRELAASGVRWPTAPSRQRPSPVSGRRCPTGRWPVAA